MSRMTAKAPPNPFQKIHRGKMLNDELLAQMRIDSANPETQWGLGIAAVVEVDYEDWLVTLRVLVGAAGDGDRAPVPLTCPGAGSRHFLGAMPQIGDMCVVGWMPQESLKPTVRTPVILSWILPGTYAGKNWMTTSPFGDAELDQTSLRQRDVLGSTFPRIRHKLRHLHPGNVMGFSAQGSDLILDEGVTLSNRRGNEIRLRDQDQAVVTRALQRFDALAGVRAYHGMVQRDATFLLPSMVGDGKDWAGKQLRQGGRPLPEGSFPDDPNAPEGFLVPARVLGKKQEVDGSLTTGLFTFDEHIDPYIFLKRGGLIDESGFTVNPDPTSDGFYGGKSIYRVAAQKDVNAIRDPGVPTLTEYRVEVTHTTDGRLPVTEQTDGFDAERLPLSDPETPGGTPNAPFIEYVMGSVVGNDPWTDKGRKLYGLPVIPKVFEGDKPAPRLDPAPLAVSEKTSSPPPGIGEHAATLFKLNPVDNGPSTWWSVNKKGQWRGTISGPRNEASVELLLAGGLTLGLGGRLNLLMQGGLSLGTKSKQSLHLTSEEGPVTLYGGGPIRGAEGAAARNGSGDDSDLPSIDIQARTNARIRAGRKVLIKGRVLETQAKQVNIRNAVSFDLDAANGKVNIKAETVDFVVVGKRKDEFSGPKNFNPTAGALHERRYTPAFPGLVCEEVNYTWGDREETFFLGNHTTTILIGNATYQTRLGAVTLQAALSKLAVSPTGIDGSVPVGTVSLTALAGTASMSALAGVLVEATAGVATVRGALGVVLSGPIYGPDVGPIICAGSLEPFTGLPFLTWGMGAKGHLVTP
jgi:hypothetical protein